LCPPLSWFDRSEGSDFASSRTCHCDITFCSFSSFFLIDSKRFIYSYNIVLLHWFFRDLVSRAFLQPPKSSYATFERQTRFTTTAYYSSIHNCVYTFYYARREVYENNNRFSDGSDPRRLLFPKTSLRFALSFHRHTRVHDMLRGLSRGDPTRIRWLCSSVFYYQYLKFFFSQRSLCGTTIVFSTRISSSWIIRIRLQFYRLFWIRLECWENRVE